MNPKTFRRSAIVAAIVPAAIWGAWTLHADPGAIDRLHLPGIASAQAADTAAAAPTRLAALPDFSALVAQASPAVVAIRVTQTTRTAFNPGGMPMDRDDPFYEFFRRFQMPGGQGGPGAGRPQRQGIGSGFIVSADGYVLTNAHVVANADEVTVKLADKRELTAKVVGSDDKSDVALLKVDAGDLPTLRIGDPGKLRVGEWVAAIGSPFGLESTVTAGIVSAKGREIGDDSYVPFIQTDVPINPGNSGGPLLNMNGEVVGINSQIFSRSGGYMGLSFSIPIDVAMRVERQLARHGKVERGLLGVTVQSVTPELADSFRLDGADGALVSGVTNGSPADKAGIRAGDVVRNVNGKAVSGAADLSRAIADLAPGEKAHLVLRREGKDVELDVAVGRMAGPDVADAGDTGAGTGRLGVMVRPADDGDGGLLVERVTGPAARAGIEPGDVIVAVNTQRVKDPEQLKKLVARADKTVALLIRRNDAEIFVPVKIG
ncbi:MAG: DegQ family serine endoprotease [Gammaproteobacteria bacterium]